MVVVVKKEAEVAGMVAGMVGVGKVGAGKVGVG